MSVEISLKMGNCLDLLPSIPTGSIDMVLCDLPYGTTGHAWDTVIDLACLWREYNRVCKKNAAVLLFAQCPFDKVLGCSNLAELRYEWVWEKSISTGFPNARRMPLKTTENILCFYRELPTYNPQGLREIEPRKVSAKGKKTAQFTGGAMPDYVQTQTNFPQNLLSFPVERGLHPTQKPVSLLEYLILTYTHLGETVLDNTMGSGSTMLAAYNTGRNGIGMEMNPKYFATAWKRLRDARQSGSHR